MSNIKCEDFISTPVIREKCIKYKPDVFAQRIEQILGKLPREAASKILSHLEKKRLLAIDEDPFVGDYVIVGARADEDNGTNSGSAYIFTDF